LRLPIHLYRLLISPWLPPMCRFEPTCSAYALEALRTHPVHRALWLIVWRLWRCQPFYPGGYDPVPPRCGCSKAEGDKKPSSSEG
jgi:putative membrane protein insertion efficiency factor